MLVAQEMTPASRVATIIVENTAARVAAYFNSRERPTVRACRGIRLMNQT